MTAWHAVYEIILVCLFLLRELLEEFVASANEMQPPHAAYLVGTVPKDWPERVRKACSLSDCFSQESDD